LYWLGTDIGNDPALDGLWYIVAQATPVQMADVQGIFAAAITPRGKQGEIDFGASFELVDLLASGGANGIALFTGAGEYAALAPDERSRLVYLAVKRSRIPVLVGVGSATLDDSVSLARAARDAGAAGLLLPPPYFFRYEQVDVHEFYQQFAAHVGAGAVTFLSNNPLYTTPIEVDTARALIASGHFAGIEEASGDAQTFTCMKTASPCVLAGSDPFLPEALRAGANGAVSGVAGALPELVVGLDRAIRGGKEGEAQELERNLRDFLAWCAEFPQPAALRVTAGMRGIKTGAHSAPLSTSKQKRMEEFQEWLQGWLPGVIVHR
jgi:4-hydroxy-tetrahydrodipicolinate synthase